MCEQSQRRMCEVRGLGKVAVLVHAPKRSYQAGQGRAARAYQPVHETEVGSRPTDISGMIFAGPHIKLTTVKLCEDKTAGTELRVRVHGVHFLPTAVRRWVGPRQGRHAWITNVDAWRERRGRLQLNISRPLLLAEVAVADLEEMRDRELIRGLALEPS